MKKTMRLICLLFASLILCAGVVQCGDKENTPTEKPDVPGEPDEPDPGPDEPEKPEEGIDGYPVGLLVKDFTHEFSDGSKCLGYYAVVDFAANDKLAFLPQYSASKAPTKYFSDYVAQGKGTPYVAINAGYFAGGKSLSLLISRSVVKSIAVMSDYYQATQTTFYPVRAALGDMGDGTFDATWIYCVGDDSNRPYSFPSALDNDEKTQSFMAEAPTSKTPGAKLWDPRYAVGGGPMLVYEGKNVAVENYWKEVFEQGGGAGLARHPRTAIGVTEDNKLVLCVCDGRGKRGSKGFTMAEMGDFLISKGCVAAVNLDGGGSSTFVGREGRVLNMPSDTPGTELEGATIKERAIPTAVIIAEE